MKKSYYTFNDLLKIMDRLRSKDGCPWDRKQTHKSLLPYLTEESNEYKRAVRSLDYAEMSDELGDILLQVVFHAQLAKEKKIFTIRDVIQNICRKMVRRHPHVFGKLKTNSIPDIMKTWEKIKQRERNRKRSKNIKNQN